MAYVSRHQFMSYLKSAEFRHVKNKFKQNNKSLKHLKVKGKWSCYCCGEVDGTNVESLSIVHKTYDNLMKENIETDLVPVCSACLSHVNIFKSKDKWLGQRRAIEKVKKMFEGK